MDGPDHLQIRILAMKALAYTSRLPRNTARRSHRAAPTSEASANEPSRSSSSPASCARQTRCAPHVFSCILQCRFAISERSAYLRCTFANGRIRRTLDSTQCHAAGWLHLGSTLPVLHYTRAFSAARSLKASLAGSHRGIASCYGSHASNSLSDSIHCDVRWLYSCRFHREAACIFQ